MSDWRETPAFQKLNQELMTLLGAQDAAALDLIHKIKAMGMRRKDNALTGYAYYRYAYYYYFTKRDIPKFRKYVQEAVYYLLRSDDKEYLGGTYQLLAYDAQDMGCYDMAYAYFMIAVRASEQKEGIALPGLIEASAGRLLIELGEYKKGRRQQKSAIRRLKAFEDMHTFHYNMILTFADIALASFKLNDAEEVERALALVEEHYEASDKKEKRLSRNHYYLTGIYHALIAEDDTLLEEKVHGLVKHWKSVPENELYDFLYEIETLCDYMLAHDYIRQVEQILNVTAGIARDENLAIVLRYATLQVAYYEKTHDLKRLKESLRYQQEIRKRKDAEVATSVRFAMEFTDMVERIAAERKKAEEENIALQKQANTDALTGLPNRNAMTGYLQQKLEEAEKAGTRFGIGIIDVDRFKEYNDTYGHQAGDECLRKIGGILLDFNDDPRVFCARYGGDEFVVGYFGLTTAAIRKIDRAMRDRVLALEVGAADAPVEISQGICNRVPDGRMKLWDYLTLADKELYRIKKA